MPAPNPTRPGSPDPGLPPWRATRRLRALVPLVPLALALSFAPLASAETPYPACALPACDPACAPGDGGCIGPDDYADYLFLAPGVLPNDYSFDPNSPGSGSGFVFEGVLTSGPGAGVRAGHDVVGAWQIATGRPDVVTAVLDSGIEWDRADVALHVALNTGELPLPAGCPASYDCNADGVVNVTDFAGAACGPGLANTVSDANGNANGVLDGQDLILLCSDGSDDDANGYVDDIAGWDFHEDDNDPEDNTRYGHGTGEARDQVAEANDGSGMPGIAPASMFVPLKVSDSFVAIGTDFAQAVVYAVDRQVSLISEALGTVSGGPTGQAAIDYAYARGIPLVASAADEQSIHHNAPAIHDHTIWVNSVRPADGDFIAEKTPPEFTLQNGCTNHGGKAWVAIASKACSSEATGRAAGMISLLVAHGRNLMDRGLLSPYPGLTTPFSAEEVRQLLRQAAVDIDHTADPLLSFTPAGSFIAALLSDPGQGLVLEARHFDTQAGWDQYTGYGRPDAVAMLSVTEATIPPEADLSGGLAWFDIVDPAASPTVPIVGSARALRRVGLLSWDVEVGCGVQPTSFTLLDSGTSAAPLSLFTFHDWNAGATAAACGFDPSAVVTEPDAHTVTLRLQVEDALGNVAEDRRTVAIHTDTSLAASLDLGASIEASPTLADVDGDHVLDIVVGTSAGEVHALDGATGAELPGFPVTTDPIAVHASAAYGGLVPIPRESILGAAAVDDLDGDGTPEVVVSTSEGSVYVFGHDGTPHPGFPVHTDPALSASALRDPYNDLDPGISSAPTLADLDAGGGSPDLEIVVGAWDGHVYAWRQNGAVVTGFPRKLADASRVSIDPVTGKVTPSTAGVRERLSKIVSSPAVGDVDGDGEIEIVATTNEEYVEAADTFDADSDVFQNLKILLALADIGDLNLDVAGRIYVLNHDGTLLDEIGGTPTSWPAPVPVLVAGLLPNVATGTPGSPALADVDGDGDLEIAIFGSIGPAVLYDGTGAAVYPLFNGSPSTMAIDFPGIAPGNTQPGFPAVPATAGSADAPFFPGLGSGAFGDIDGDVMGLPEYVAPTAGFRVLIDTLAAGSQEYSDHQISAWNPATGALLPAFPRIMDDLQFLTAPALGDVSGDGLADVVNGSGAYLVRAYQHDGTVPAGFPKFTHGWLIASPAIGDVDDDGANEVVGVTREGRLFVWNTSGVSSDDAIQWQSANRDRRNTQNRESGVTRVPEPGALVGLVAGACGLGVLQRARRRSTAKRHGAPETRGY